MRVVKRTFEAKRWPKGSPERAKLNEDWRTSEYMPSHRFGVRGANGEHTPFTYRTQKEAAAKAIQLLNEAERKSAT